MVPEEPSENPEEKDQGQWFFLTSHFVRPSDYCFHPTQKTGQFPGYYIFVYHLLLLEGRYITYLILHNKPSQNSVT